MSVKKFGCDNKKRFSVKYPDGRIERYGTCDPNDDERFRIVCFESGIWNMPGKENEIQKITSWLIQYQQHDLDYSQPEKQRQLLQEGTLIANGYYDHEHDTFISPADWLKQA